MNESKKILTKIGLAVAGIGVIVGCGIYAAKNDYTLVFGQRPAVIRKLNEGQLDDQNRLYLISYNAEKLDAKKSLESVDKYVVDRLTPDDKVAYISQEVKELPVNKLDSIVDSISTSAGIEGTLDLFGTNVLADASADQRLDLVKKELGTMSLDKYGAVLETMAKRAGKDLYSKLVTLLNSAE